KLNVDGTAPTASVSKSPSGWTNGNVQLKVKNIKDNSSGYYRTKLPNGKYTTSKNPSYTATSNKTYKFVIYDHVGNKTTKSIKVSNIDRTKPTASISATPSGWTNGDVTIKISNIKDK